MRDATGSLRAVWFNQPFLKDVFHPHQRVILFGKLELTSHGLQMQNPQYEILRRRGAMRRRAGASADGRPPSTPAGSSRSTRRPGTLTAKMQRALVHQALQALPADAARSAAAGGARSGSS